MKSDIGRYAMVPEWLLDAGISGNAMRLFVCLAAKFADRETGEATPSRTALGAALGGLSVDTIDRATKELITVGALAVEPRFVGGERTSNRYMLFFAAPENRATMRPPRRIVAATVGGTDAATGGRTGAAQNQNHPEPESLEPEADHPRERESLDDDPEMATASRALTKARIAINAYVADDLADFLDRGTKGEWVAAACAIAASNGAKSWNYVKRILEGWGSEGPPQREETNAGTNGNGKRGTGRSGPAVRPDPDNPLRRRLELDRANEAAELAELAARFAPGG